MNSNELLTYLSNPAVIDDLTVELLKNEIENYPFFQPLYFPLLKYYKNIKSNEYGLLLQKYSLSISDRRKLYLFLNDRFTSEILHQNLLTVPVQEADIESDHSAGTAKLKETH
jgi:hypothetical protein